MGDTGDQERLKQEARAILAYLFRRPNDWGLFLWLAEHDSPTPRDFLPFEGVARERIERFLGAACAGYCGECFVPLAMFPDGTRLAWPELTPHRCGPVAQEQRQAAQTRSSEGANPSGAIGQSARRLFSVSHV